jgi:selenide,water dikinase
MSELAQVLRPLLPVDSPEALVDAATRDDAAVYRIAEDRALVVTVDFFTPVVDDPLVFGRIGASNALSDIYAMGARPLFALNIVGFPRKLLGSGALEEIIRGGAEIAAEAGVLILGGHSIDDPEPKYGMVVVGEVHPDRIITNTGAEPGHDLILTKPLGTGIIATAIKSGAASPVQIKAAVESMSALNRAGGELIVDAGIRTATDVTGYGLLGHLQNLVFQSGVSATLSFQAVPIIPGAVELAQRGNVPGGTRRNMQDLEGTVRFFPEAGEIPRILLSDAQTSGGLLIVSPPEKTAGLLALLRHEAPWAAVIGRITEGSPGTVTIEP